MGDLGDRLAKMSPEKRQYALETLPSHLAEASQSERFYKLLTDFDFIDAKISALGAQSLIEDYDFAFNADELFSGEKAETLRLIQGAIRLSAHILEKDKTQLAGQLLGRLMSFELSDIKLLLEQVKLKKNCSWLRPLNSNLTLPGGRLLRTLIGHTGAILTLGVTPDGKWVISGSSDNTIKIWNLKTGQEIFTLTGHTDKVNVVALTPDGKRLISGSSDKSIKIWNLETGEELFTLMGHTNEVNVIAVEPDGTWFVSGSNDTTLKMWELETGEEFFTLTGHTDSILAVAVSPDGSQVWSGSKDKTYKCWDLVTEEILTYSPKESVPYLTFTPDGKQRVVQIGDPQGYSILCISDLENQNKPKVLSNLIDEEGIEMALNNIVIKPDNYQQVIYSFLMSYDFCSGMLCMFDTKEEKFIFSFEAHTSEVKSLTITPDSKCLISGGKDKIIKVWNMEKIQHPIFISKTTHDGVVTKLIFTKYDNRLVSKSSGKNIKVWDWKTEQLIFSLSNEDSVSDLVVTLDDKWLIAAYLGYSISVWELSTGKEIFTFTHNNSWVNAVAVTPDNQLLISGSSDGTIKVWNLETTEEVFTLIGHSDGISKVSVTPDGKRLISSSWDKTIKVWNLETGQQILTFIAHASLPEPQVKIFGMTGRVAVTIDAVTPNGKLVISSYNCFHSQERIIWSLEDGKEIVTFNGDLLAVTPDSKRVIYRLNITTIKVYDLQLKEEIFTLEGHTDFVNNVTITSDSLWMFSWSEDTTIKVWNLDIGTEEFTLYGHRDSINSVALTADNKRLISASSDHSLKVWDLATRKVIDSFTGDDVLTCCAVAPDGVTIAAGEASGRVHFLRLEGC